MMERRRRLSGYHKIDANSVSRGKKSEKKRFVGALLIAVSTAGNLVDFV